VLLSNIPYEEKQIYKRPMFSVALIGPDGAGKTTIARMLEKSFPLSIAYLYMGVSFDSSNVALPTTRLAEYFKRIHRKKSRKKATLHPLSSPPSAPAPRQSSGKLRATLRLLNRLAEEWYRQWLSWKCQRKGRIVVYDRHFQFDFERDNGKHDGARRRWSDRLHRWCLANLYPRPSLVIYLDAPAEVLFARKGEMTLEWLESRRQAFLRQGRQMPNFVRVDATQALEEVYAEVTDHILQFSMKE
jgi:thymidylate kinase